MSSTQSQSTNHLFNGPLSAAEVEQFIGEGFVKVPAAFDAGPGSDAQRWIEESWALMGLDKDDPGTWPPSPARCKASVSLPLAEFAPRVFAALAQLTGGSENVVDPSYYNQTWEPKTTLCIGNEFNVNYQLGWDQPWKPPSASSPGWHVDGDWFTHYLDSPEQGLLMIVCWADMVHQGGATFMSPDSIGPVAKCLSGHPEGVSLNRFEWSGIMSQCHDYREVIGQAGDIFLVHPFMMHASSYNVLRKPRFITNPPVSRREPMRFHRTDGTHYDAMELAVLRALGVDYLDFAITGERRCFSPGEG